MEAVLRVNGRQIEGRPGRLVLLTGAASAAVYLLLAGRLSWWRHREALQSWSQLLGADGATCAICLGGVGLLMALYVWGLRYVRTGDVSRRTVWAFAFVFSGVLLWLLPITSDLFTYLSHARMLTDLGANPLLHAPVDFEDPVILAYSTIYAVRPTVYGPVWLLLSAMGTAGPYDVPFGILYLKGLAAAAYLGSAWLIERILLQHRREAALEGLYLFAWSPFVLLMAVGDGHNDMAMMALALLAVWLLLRKRWIMAFGVLALSGWVKYVSLALFPLFGIYVWQHLGRRWRRELFAPLARGTIAAMLVSFAAMALVGWTDGLLGLAERLMHPLNWRGGGEGLPTLLLGVGMSLLVLIYILLLHRASRGDDSFQCLVNLGFLAFLFTFVLGVARSQPWHLLWPASFVGLSDYRWAVPLCIAFSGIMLAVQIGVEWAIPGLAFAI